MDLSIEVPIAERVIISVVEFADLLHKYPNYKGGAVRLISCNTGSDDAIAAQALANNIRVEVMTPTKTLWIDMDGNIAITDTEEHAKKLISTGKWKRFYPRRRI